jgi:hypothetical protein
LGDSYALSSSFLVRCRGRVCCFKCSRVRRWSDSPARTLCFGSQVGDGGFCERFGVGETIYALSSSFLVRLRGRVCCSKCSRVRRWSDSPARTLCFGSQVGDGGFCERFGVGETIYALSSSFLVRLRGRVCCFKCSRVRRWSDSPASTLSFGMK